MHSGVNIKGLLRDALAFSLNVTRITYAAKRHKNHFVVVTFHRVLPKNQRRQYPYPGLAVTPTEFRWFLNFFKRSYTCGSLKEVHSRYCNGERPSRPLLAITFDDGQLDNYIHARPILAELELSASFFIPINPVESSESIWHDRLGFATLRALRNSTPKNLLMELIARDNIAEETNSVLSSIIAHAKTLPIDERIKFTNSVENLTENFVIPDWAGLMQWEQARELVDDGHEIGSHSMTHELLPKCSAGEIEFEVSESKSILENRLNTEISSFCYPNGDHDNRAVDAVQRAGYGRAVTTTWGSNDSDTNIFTLRRCDMNPFNTRTQFGQLSEPVLAFRLSGLHPGLRA